MDDFEFNTDGAPVIFSNVPEKPYNPLNRPEISLKKPIIAVIIYISVFLGLMIPFLCAGENLLAIVSVIVWSLLFFVIIAKRAAIWAVHLYQNKAPDKVRLKCVFTPSCSEYMIMSIEKYGFIKGVFKGIDRLRRCHFPNGGEDLP